MRECRCYRASRKYARLRFPHCRRFSSPCLCPPPFRAGTGRDCSLRGSSPRLLFLSRHVGKRSHRCRKSRPPHQPAWHSPRLARLSRNRHTYEDPCPETSPPLDSTRTSSSGRRHRSVAFGFGTAPTGGGFRANAAGRTLGQEPLRRTHGSASTCRAERSRCIRRYHHFPAAVFASASAAGRGARCSRQDPPFANGGARENGRGNCARISKDRRGRGDRATSLEVAGHSYQ